MKARPATRILVALFLLGATAACLVAAEGLAALVLAARGSAPDAFLLGEGLLAEPDEEDRVSFERLDPHLSHAHDPEALREKNPDAGWIPGFLVHGSLDDPHALRVVALGGSTTDPFFFHAWPRALYETLRANGVRATVLNGGVAGYSSNQELLKLLRDVIPLEPNVVVSLSGINDLGFGHSLKRHPFVHPYQAATLEGTASAAPPPLLPNLVRLLRSLARAEPAGERVTYGPEVSTTPGRQWTRNVRLMRAAAEEVGIRYLAFRQPVLGVGRYEPSPEEEAMLREAIDAREKHGDRTYLDHVRDFYAATREPCAELDACVDLVHVFEGTEGAYRDARHQTPVGTSVLADAVYRELLRRGWVEPGPADAGLVFNASFERWEGGLPSGWELPRGDARRPADGAQGETRVELDSRATERGASLVQRLHPAAGIGGRRVVARVRARSRDPAKALLAVHFRRDGEWVGRTSAPHPGDGRWRTLSVEARIPEDADPDFLAVRLFLRPGAIHRAAFDHAYAGLAEARKAPPSSRRETEAVGPRSGGAD